MKFQMFDHESAMYVDQNGVLVNEPYAFENANAAMHAGFKVLQPNDWQAAQSLEIMEVAQS